MLTEGKRYFLIPKIQNPCPLSVFGYKEGEYIKNGIREHITAIENHNDPKYLILGKGNYDIVYSDKDYNIVETKKIKIK